MRTFLFISLSINESRINRQRFFASQVISSYSLASLYFVKVLEFICSGDCPSCASTCYGKTTLLFTLVWLSTKVRCFHASCSFLCTEFAGDLKLLSLLTSSLSYLRGLENLTHSGLNSLKNNTKQRKNFVACRQTEELVGLVLTSLYTSHCHFQVLWNFLIPAVPPWQWIKQHLAHAVWISQCLILSMFFTAISVSLFLQ